MIILLIEIFILLTGMGGIGKTIVAKSYLEKYRNDYNHLSYVEVNTTISDAIIQHLSNVDKSFEYNFFSKPSTELRKSN